MKILNLYAGIGGNRKLWEDCKVTAVEFDKNIAQIYSDFFPNDTVIIGDAKDFLVKHYKEFDFIWASPPCPSHSRIRMVASKRGDYEPILPDMSLYSQIIFLKSYFKGKWVVENVIPYYEPLLLPKIVGRHCFWTNFNIGSFNVNTSNMTTNNIPKWESKHGFDLSKYKLDNKLKTLRNCVDPEVGLYILNCAREIIKAQNINQPLLF
jgi:DNA (cytosine-5)-methyltransferase 1